MRRHNWKIGSLTALLLSASYTLPAYINSPVPAIAAVTGTPKLVVDGSVVHTESPLFYGGADGRTVYAPARLALELLGYEVTWNTEEKALYVALEGTSYSHHPGTSVWVSEGRMLHMDSASILKDGSLWVPVQPLFELLGHPASWSTMTSTVYIKNSLSADIRRTVSYGYTRLSYDGETKDGLRQGFGKLYVDGELWYEGHFTGNRMNGFGKLYDKGRLVYEGAFENDLPHGGGSYYYADGSAYKGSMTRGRLTGTAKLYNANGEHVYDGNWFNGVREGQGVLWLEDGSSYNGEFHRNERQGRGALFSKDNVLVYDGDWKGGKRSGSGKEFDKSGKLIYQGQWESDQRHGTGYTYSFSKMDWYQTNDQGSIVSKTSEDTTMMREVTYHRNVLLLEGSELAYIGDDYEDGTPHGKGTLLKVKSSAKNKSLEQYYTYYEGEFEEGRMTGSGTFYNEDKKKLYEGDVQDGKRNGRGKLYENGLLIYDGEWSHDQESGIGRKYAYGKSHTGAEFEGSSTLLMYEGKYAGGKLVDPTAVYKYYGAFVNGEPNGLGSVMLMHDYKSDTGPKTLDLEQGTGYLVYEGEFKSGLREGAGKLYANNILIYEGSFKNGIRAGKGIAYIDGWLYEGEFVDDQLEGLVKATDAFRTVRFEGLYKKGKKNGYGKLYSENGLLVYEGEYKNGLRHGFGKLYSADGKTVYYQGEFRDDKTLSEYLNSLKNSQ
ncbi:stalk domain-containing protein [Paenibacillus sp. YYML68]|uniref:stalk domain-containing protein n=1 Tax=Paenibacillus sp. YYML68 TaxID=2909250 RepID=UPI002490EBA0|nr:stalk domain-containing protein [Paenibacillus sp. YYML68]